MDEVELGQERHMITYTVTATRASDWWSLVAEDVAGREVASQSRSLDQAAAEIR